MNSQQRILKVLFLVAESNGTRNKDIAAALNVSPSHVSRDLSSLQKIGVAERTSNIWTVTDNFLQSARRWIRHEKQTNKALQVLEG